MENPTPGTPEYRKCVKEKIMFVGGIFILGTICIASLITVISFNIPLPDSAKLLIAFLILYSGALCLVALLCAVAILLTAWAQTRLVRLQSDQSKT